MTEYMAVQMCSPILGSHQFANGVATTGTSTFRGATSAFGILGSDWIALTFLALACSLLALVLLHMLANFLRNQTLIAWTKFELFQILGTAVIFIFAVGWVTEMCKFDMGFLDVSYAGHNMYELVDNYFTFMRGVGAALFGYMMYFSKLITLLQKVTYFSSPLGLGMTDNPLDSLGQLNSVLFFAVGGFVTSYLMLDLQFKMMQYMAFAVMYFLFPFGIFFRGFEPTRGFGGTLIGISLAFFLFYPITVVFNDYIIRIANPGLFDATSPAAQAQINQNVANTPGEKQGQEIVADQLTNKGNVEQLVKGVGSGTIWIIKPLALYIIAAVVLPIINFLVLAELAKGISKLYGEEVDITNLTRMI